MDLKYDISLVPIVSETLEEMIEGGWMVLESTISLVQRECPVFSV